LEERPLADAPYLLRVPLGQTRLFNDYAVADQAEAQMVIEQLPARRRFYIIDRASRAKVELEALP
jgi:hypothetical protein